jgi:phage-related protein
MCRREIIFFKGYFWDFYGKLDSEAQKKTEWTLGLIRDLRTIPFKYFKSIKGSPGLFELRVHCRNDAYRVFCVFDDNNRLVLLNGFHKKTNRTPRREIEKALRLKKDYFHEKESKQK